jgi:hypothetical protein
MEDRFYATREYLLSCAKWPKAADQLEPAIFSFVRKFYEQLEQTPTGSPLDLGYPVVASGSGDLEREMFGHHCPIEASLIRILIQANSNPDRDTNPDAEQLLSKLPSLEKKLTVCNLDYLAEEWKKSRITMEELVGVWKDIDGYYDFRADGTYGFAESRDALSSGRLDSQGTYSAKGNVFTFESENLCGKQRGVYRLKAKTANKLTFTKRQEDCSQRRLVSLERVP